MPALQGDGKAQREGTGGSLQLCAQRQRHSLLIKSELESDHCGDRKTDGKVLRSGGLGGWRVIVLCA